MSDPFSISTLRRAGLSAEQIANDLGLPLEYVRAFLSRRIPDPEPRRVLRLLRSGLDTIEIARRCGCFEPHAWNALARTDNARAAA
jgi:hypothetical protein